MARHENSSTLFVSAAFINGIIAACSLIVGSFSPAWAVIVARDNVMVEEGIWISRSCNKVKNGCEIRSRSEVVSELATFGVSSDLDEVHWREMKVTSIFAIFAAITVTAICTKVLVCRDRKSNNFILGFGVVLSVTSCILILVPILKLSVATKTSSSLTSAWSRSLAGFGCLLEFITSVLLVFAASQTIIRTIRSKKRSAPRRRCRCRSSAAHCVPNEHLPQGDAMSVVCPSVQSGFSGLGMTSLPAYDEIVLNNFGPPSYFSVSRKSERRSVTNENQSVTNEHQSVTDGCQSLASGTC